MTRPGRFSSGLSLRFTCFFLLHILLAPVAVGEAPQGEPAHSEASPEAAGEEEGVAREPGEGHEETDGGEEEEGGEPAGEEEEMTLKEEMAHAHVTKLTWTVSVMIFGFLFVNMALLYLVNWRDADIRAQLYKMIAVTISIFCAVLLNSAMLTFLFEQFLPSPFPRGLALGPVPPWLKISLTFIIFAAMMWVMDYGIYLCRDRHAVVFGIKSIVCHLTAFAAIHCFAELQMEEEWLPEYKNCKVGGVAFLAWLVFTTLRSLFFQLRKLWQRQANPHAAASASFGRSAYQQMSGLGDEDIADSESPEAAPKKRMSFKRAHAHEDFWTEQAEEGEDEATAIAVTFLVNQWFCYLITGHIPELEGDEFRPTTVQLRMLFCVAVGAALFVTVMSVASAKYVPLLGHNAIGRFFLNVDFAGAVIMAWSLFRYTDWWTHELTDYNKPLAHALNAFIVSAGAILGILVLDAIADKIPKLLGRNSGDVPAEAVEKAVRTIIDGLGVLVGLCWEKCFSTSLLTIVEGNARLRSHFVISVGALSMLLVAFVLPAWAWYIVPKALKQGADHEKDIAAEAEREQKFQAPQ
eukprot:TRINITY_DN47419_c0_g1_i1.p1 TRINITY_DN47419_c0_g1~~TRINITY_DN47419_c0_g1_i1.p1  ORF type:complete len:578 (-),score=147.00 TRINITY_DN47419_c0_g1_i1:53-1786(-)